MILHKQPTRWSCVPTSFAMVLGHTPSFFIDCIGHDGSEIIHEGLPEPTCRRGFSITECIYVCYNLGYSVTPFDVLPLNVVDYNHTYSVWTEEEAWRRIIPIMSANSGIITGYTFQERPHAVAWNGEYIYDPAREEILSINEIQIETFWCVQHNPIRLKENT